MPHTPGKFGSILKIYILINPHLKSKFWKNHHLISTRTVKIYWKWENVISININFKMLHETDNTFKMNKWFSDTSGHQHGSFYFFFVIYPQVILNYVSYLCSFIRYKHFLSITCFCQKNFIQTYVSRSEIYIDFIIFCPLGDERVTCHFTQW